MGVPVDRMVGFHRPSLAICICRHPLFPLHDNTSNQPPGRPHGLFIPLPPIGGCDLFPCHGLTTFYRIRIPAHVDESVDSVEQGTEKATPNLTTHEITSVYVCRYSTNSNLVT